MNKKEEKETISLKKIMSDIKKADPERHNKIENNVKKRIEKLKHGGARPGAGRKPKIKSTITITKDVSPNSRLVLKSYAKKQKISENKALDEIIMFFNSKNMIIGD